MADCSLNYISKLKVNLHHYNVQPPARDHLNIIYRIKTTNNRN